MKLSVRTALLSVTLSLITFCAKSQNWDKYSVVLGERNWNEKVDTRPNDCRVITIRLDGEGNYYPNVFIRDKKMKKAKGKLSIWYKHNPKQYQAILNKHGLPNNGESIKLLNQSIENRFVHLIDSLSVDRKVVFLIHGYRKQMYKKKDNSLSTVDNMYVEKELGSNKLFVEVYWDSKHMTTFQGVFGKKGLKMMEASAVPNAKNVGVQLRTLVSSIDNSEIAVLCHSLGSVVANELTFNFDPDVKLMDGKKIKVAYMGPAIGHESFKNSFLRGSGDYELETCIGFNINDFVLLKNFKALGISINSNATTYGNTSLGCNYKGDVEKLIKMYESDLPNETLPITADMSGAGNHLFSYYARHESFSKVMVFLFKNE